MDSHSKRSTLHKVSVVCPMNDNHEGPVPPKKHHKLHRAAILGIDVITHTGAWLAFRAFWLRWLVPFLLLGSLRRLARLRGHSPRAGTGLL